MSNLAQLQANNGKLNELLASLQGKATGSGGTNIETCTVAMENEIWGGANAVFTYYATTVENGQLTIVSSQYSEPFICAQGTLVAVNYGNSPLNEIETSGCEVINEEVAGQDIVAFVIPHGSETATITFM